MRILIWASFVWIYSITNAQEMSLQEFSNGFSLPVDISNAGDERLFITEKAGLVRVLFPNGSKHPTPFLDIKNRVNSAANERGLLGLCFHPDYPQNGYLYVHYTNTAGHSTISRFTVTEDPNQADPGSEKIIIIVSQPFNNHNAGDLEFGPDGYLYIGMGDGGSGGDPGNRSQNPKNLLGKMLRLDVNTDQPYLIPPDNPWINNPDTLPEIWAFGLRNPWRFSFDRLNGDLWIGDVGQNRWEEIHHVKRGTPAVNYGWRCYEGFEAFNTAGCHPLSAYTPPVFVYRNPTLGCSVTGGFVYRGTVASRYQGRYVFADYCSGRFWSVNPDSMFPNNTIEIGRFLNNQYATFGEDKLGNLFVAGIGNGRIYKFIDPACDYLESNSIATVIPVTCHDSCDAIIQFHNLPQGTRYQWSHGPDYEIVSGLCPGQYSVTIADTIGCYKTLSWTLDTVLPLLVTLEADGLNLIASSNQQVQFVWYKDNVLIEGVNSDTLIASGTGTFHVVATNANGCSKQSSNVFVLDCAYLEMESLITQDPISCRDSCDAVLSVQHPGTGITYLWSTGETGESISGLCPGTYSVILKDTLGCEALLQLEVDTIIPLTVELNVANQFFEAFANQVVTYQWYRNGEMIPGATQKTYEATSSGEYFVVVTNEKGCTVRSWSITISKTEDPGPGDVSIKCKSLSRDGFFFLFDKDIFCKVTAFDLSGRIIHVESNTYTANAWNKIEVNGGIDGYFFLHFVTPRRPYVYKVFLKH